MRAIEVYLQDQFSYNENPPDHRYPLSAFLFQDRIGYCQQFSGAMALMLRMAGIPSRVATGFSPGTRDTDEKHRYLVSDLDAHSWVEAYFPGIGWVTFDPTAGTAPASAQSDDLPPQIGSNPQGVGDEGGRLRNYAKPAAARYVAKLRANRFSATDPGAPTLADRCGLRDDLSSRNGLRSRLRGLRALPPGGPSG